MICDSPFYVLPKAAFEKVPVPCGRCPPCKKNRVNGWVFRMLQQEKVSTSAHFVTLTYDTHNVPISQNGYMTLLKKDFQDFMKRLRKICGDAKLKYYAVGEYGTNNNRPHYHAIIFNCPDPLYYDQAWGLGSMHVGSVSGNSIAYTMKYIDKHYKKRLHARDDREFEFPLMSKGLGKNYLSDEIVKYHQSDISRLFLTKEGGFKIAMPRYYKEKIYTDDQRKAQAAIADQISRENEEFTKRNFDLLYPDTSLTYQEYVVSKKYGRYEQFYSKQKNRDL